MPAQMRIQPQGNLRINRAHPMAAGLVDVWLPGVSTRGLLSGVDSSTVAGGSTSATPAGLGFRCTSTSRRYSTSILNSTRVAWLIIAARDGSGNVGQSVVRKDGTITPLQDFDGNVRVAYFDSGGGFIGSTNYGSSSSFANKTSTFCGYVGPDRNTAWANNGPELAFGSGGAVTGNRSNPFCIGGNEGGNEIATAWTVVAVFAWQGANIPTPERLRAFTNNPWALFDGSSSTSTYQSAIASSATAAGADGNATVTGVSSTAASGSVAGSGGATGAVTSTAANASTGSVAGAGSASTAVSGAQANGNTGSVSSSGGANAGATGNQASGQSGTVSASSAAAGTATVMGVAASSQAGTIAGSGNAMAAPSGVPASGQSGTVTASAGTAGNAVIMGNAASTQSGSVSSSGSASTLPSGQAASAQSGTVTAVAGGNANVAITGIAALIQAGTIIAKGNGLATLAGTNANGAIGSPSGSGSSQGLLFGAVAYGQSGQASAIGGNGNASVAIFGAGASALIGNVSASFIPSSIGLNITEDMICKAVRSYILSIRPGLRVIRTPVNLASMPNGPYVSFTPGRRIPLSTNVAGYLSGSRTIERDEQMAFQIDCYGDGARDLADTINLLFRDQYAIDQFAQSGYDITPLYAGDVMQMPFVDDADQYEDRYSFEIFLQINSVVITPQQSCNMLGINILSVDATYPPV